MHRLAIELATISIVPLWLYFSIFCYEMSHFITARKLGFNPYLVRIGVGGKY
jgi:membrane-associated protease RseP (regulator of RpoE activity)